MLALPWRSLYRTPIVPHAASTHDRAAWQTQSIQLMRTIRCVTHINIAITPASLRCEQTAFDTRVLRIAIAGCAAVDASPFPLITHVFQAAPQAVLTGRFTHPNRTRQN